MMGPGEEWGKAVTPRAGSCWGDVPPPPPPHLCLVLAEQMALGGAGIVTAIILICSPNQSTFPLQQKWFFCEEVYGLAVQKSSCLCSSNNNF